MKEKLMNSTLKQKIISVVVIIVLIGGSIGGYYIYRSLNKKSSTPTLDMASLYQDEVVSLGNIVVGLSESGTASLVYEEIDLNVGYEVTEILAVVGVQVDEGDVLAKLDLEASELDDTDAIEDLEAAKDALDEKKIEVEAKSVQAEGNYNKAVAAGESAKTIYDLTIDEIDAGLSDMDDRIEELEESIDSLQYQIKNGLNNDLGLEESKEELQTIEESIIKKETEIAELDNANSSIQTDVEQAKAELEQLEKNYESQLSKITSLTVQYDEAYDALPNEINDIEAQLASKKTERAKYVANMPGDKVDAKAVYDANMNAYNNASADYTLTLASLEKEVKIAEDLVETLTANLEDDTAEEAQENVIIDADGNLLAPCSGYVTSVTEPASRTVDGNTVKTGLNIAVSDGDYAKIDVSVSQDDIADIYIGMETNIVFDAYEDIVITAVVDSLSLTPSGDMGSSVNYTVSILCDIPQDKGMTIFSSMTSTVTFVKSQKTDVMVISANYVGNEDGSQYVYVEQSDGSVKKTEIVTGFSDGFDVEIVSGVEVGDIIVNESAVSSIENK